MDSLRAARYPFLSEASEFAEANSEGIEKLLSSETYAEARERGLARVMGALDNHTIPENSLSGEYNRLMEVLSYPYARILVSCVGDRLLLKRYALAEAEHMNHILTKDPDSVDLIVKELEVNATANRDGTVDMHFADFLRFSYVMKAVEWKLINSDIHNGFVTLPRDKFVRLLQNAYRLKIESELPLNVPDDFRKDLSSNLAKIDLALSAVKTRLSPTGGQGMNDAYLPPCIRTIIEMAQAGQNLPHSARFALVTFLHALGLEYSQIIAIFAVSPDFNEAMSEYQIKHITGELNGTEGYTPPVCSTMRTNGLCFDPDPLCEKVKHPLSYYRIKSGNYQRQPKE